MIQDEYDASLDSEMLIYYTGRDNYGNTYRQYTFNHPILFDKLELPSKNILKTSRKLRNKAIYKPKGFAEEQIANYQKSNRYWCSLYARYYRIVEEFNIDMKNKIMNNQVSDTELLRFFCENIERVVEKTIDPILKFEEYYKEVNEIYGNHLFSL